MFFKHCLAILVPEPRTGDHHDRDGFAVRGLRILPLDARPLADCTQGRHHQPVCLGGLGLALPAAAPGRHLHPDGVCDERLRVIQVQGCLVGQGRGLA